MNGNKEISAKKHEVTNTSAKKGTNVRVKEKIEEKAMEKRRIKENN